MTVTGYARILIKRKMGGICFLRVRFQEADTQCILHRKTLANYEQIVRLPVGSVIYLAGKHGESASGTPSIIAETISIVSICRDTLPDKHKGVTDVVGYKNRTKGLLANPESFGLFKAMALTNERVRHVLGKHGYLEFDTGVLQPSFEAGLANSFATVCQANGKTYHLALTSEMKLKRLIAGGFDSVYEIGHSFRNEGINATHYPEFGVLEAYRATDSMENALLVISEILKELAEVSQVATGTAVLGDDFIKPPLRIDFEEAMVQATDGKCSSLIELVEHYPDLLSHDMPGFTLVYKALIKIIGPHFESPTFLTNVPEGFNPFCQMEGGKTKQAVLVAKGVHIATISVDENDVEVVKGRMQKQHDEAGVPFNTSYLDLLYLGVPPIAGFGLGMSRLSMLLVNKENPNIRDVILFPFA